jgi:hypothetical protein
MLDAHALRAMLGIADDLSTEGGSHSTVLGNVATQEPHHVRTSEGADPVANQARVDLGQGRCIAKGQVRSPLALVGRPIVGRTKFAEEACMGRMELVDDPIE